MIDVQTNKDKTHILIYPNQSMSSNAYWVMFSLLAGVTLVIAIVLATQGTWVIIPFAILHMLFVWWGFKKAYQNSEIIQYITIGSSKTVFGSSKYGEIRNFQTPWVKVKLTKDKKNQHTTRLFLMAHDKMCEIGYSIVEEERVELSHEIQRALHPFCVF